MYAISLTTIPPRFDRLQPVLHSLLAQDPAPTEVVLNLPRRFHRFPGTVVAPTLPASVRLHWVEEDVGPATKILPSARALSETYDHIIYCDDDWLMPSGWAATLLSAQSSEVAVAGSGYNVARLGRVSATPTGFVDIAQGYSGVLVKPAWLAGRDLNPPSSAWPVDDIWLSGQLARLKVPIQLAAAATNGLKLAFEDEYSLQDNTVGHLNRDAANRSCAALLNDRFGIWPKKR